MVSSQHIKRSGLYFVSVLLITGLLLPVAESAIAEQITQEYTFERPVIDQITIDGQTYDRIVMRDAPNGGHVGEPSLPARGATILLPYGSRIVSVEVTEGRRIPLGGGYYVTPVTPPFPLSLGPNLANPPRPDPDIYSQSQPFPAVRYRSMGTQTFRGYGMAVVKLRPVEYIPASGELFYYSSLTVTVTTEPDGTLSDTYRGFSSDRNAVFERADNCEQVATYPPVLTRPAAGYDLLIISHPVLAVNFQPLKEYHDTTGVLTEIHTTGDVGSTDPDDIRDYIRDQYLTNGIQYVLIGAADRFIPAKDLFVQAVDVDGTYTAPDMPTDMYFGCLDGTFNYDGDDREGEPTDGEGGGDVDLVAEVYVGRACVANSADVDNFVNKTIRYLESDQPYLENVLLAGEHLTFGGWGEYGGYSLDQLVDSSDADGYSTIGIPSTVYTIDKLYDLTWPGNAWPSAEVVSRINSGRQIVNHYGHCNFFSAMKLHKALLEGAFSNDDHCFIYSQGCMAGQFDGYAVGTPAEQFDCWAEQMSIKIDHGAFAVVMNARYGFGDWSTDGAAHRFNREFWDAVFNPAESYPEIGRANQDSKEDNLYRIDEPAMRWSYYELNVFGDPTISLKSEGSLAFDYPGGSPQQVDPGETTTFGVEVRGVCGGFPVPGSGQLHYSINGGTEQTVAMTETSDNNYEAVLPALECGDVVEYSVSAEEALRGRVYHPVVTDAFFAIPVTEVVTVFEDDFETDNGWTISGGLWARGIPTGGGGTVQQYGTPDPTSGCNGPNVMGYNLNGDYQNSLPEYHVTSPAIDCSNLHNMRLEFARWLGVERPFYDHASVRVSNNGTDWTVVWENGATIGDREWVDMDLDISAVADDQATVYLRWTMGTTSSSGSYCGWNVDDVRVVSYDCRAGCCGRYTGGYTGNTNCDEDGKRNLADISRLIDRVYLTKALLCCEENGNVNGDIEEKINLADISRLIDHVYLTKEETESCP